MEPKADLIKKRVILAKSDLEKTIITSDAERALFDQVVNMLDKMPELSTQNSDKKSIQKSIQLFESPSCPIVLAGLPAEMGGKILDMTINNTDNDLKKVKPNIHKLYSLCKSMQHFMDDQKNSLHLIKELSFISGEPNDYVAMMIPTEGARKLLFIQQSFDAMCQGQKNRPISKKNFSTLKDFGYDIDFTYGRETETQLAKACRSYRTWSVQPLMVKPLLEQGADYTICPKNRVYHDTIESIIFNLLENVNAEADEALDYFFASPHFNINHYYEAWNFDVTALWFLVCSIAEEDQQKTFFDQPNPRYTLKLRRLQKLLDNGADPELTGSTEVTPLVMAQAAKDQNIIDMLEKAIAHKKAQELKNKEVIKKEDTPKKRAHKRHASKEKQHKSKKHPSKKQLPLPSPE